MYRVRKSWTDEKSQIGAYEILQNAIIHCPLGYKVFDNDGTAVYEPSAPGKKGFQAVSLIGLSDAEKIKKIAPLYQAVMKKTGMLASVGLAQFCLESAYGTSDLAQNANNLHGMKCSLSGNKWANSTWDGKSKYTKFSGEVYDGVPQSKQSDFRKYECCEDSIADRAAYLIGAMNGSVPRYPNINKIKNAEEQIRLIKAGGYATSPSYVENLMRVVNAHNLTQYDNVQVDPQVEQLKPAEPQKSKDNLYRVRRTWQDAASQKGAYEHIENARALVDTLNGYSVFDSEGKAVYTKLPYIVKIDRKDISIRQQPTQDSAVVKLINPGKFTMVEVRDGTGSITGWGKLKSGLGWIPLDSVTIES